mgnify:CR=1 FL=1
MDSWPEGMKKTKQRKGVLSVLEKADKPLSASEVCSKLEANEEPAWLSTVYRILELFVEKEMVVKTNVLNNISVYELNRHKHKHYAICMKCNKMIRMNNCPMIEFVPELEDQKFSVVGHNLEFFGFCIDCKPR